MNDSKELTLQDLKDMPYGIFAQGETIDSPEGVNMANTGKTMRWVAVRGDIHDWAIYTQNPHYIDSTEPEVLAVGYGGVWDWDKIASNGDKVHNRENVKRLVPCDEGALSMYRD